MTLLLKRALKIQPKIAWLLVFSFGSLCLAITFLYINKKNIEKTDAWVGHTTEVIVRIGEINILVLGTESPGRPDPSLHLELKEQIGWLRQLTGDNPHQQNNIKELSEEISRSGQIGDSISALPQSASMQEARLALYWRQRQISGKVNSLLHSMMQEETAMLSQRQQVSKEEYRKNTYDLIAGKIFAFLFVALILFELNKDIGLRKRAEKRLANNELKYRSLVENAGAVMYSTDLQGKINFASSKATDLTGYALEELEGTHFSALVEPSCIEKVKEHYYNQLQSGIKETTLTFLIHTKEGKEKWVEQSAVLLLEKNNPVGFQCIVKDISEKKQMQLELEQFEFKLKENQLLLQSIVDNTTSLIYIKDLAGRYIMVNRHFKEVLDLEEDQVLHKTDHEITEKEVADHYKMLDEEVIRTGRSLETEELVHTPKGDINLLLVKFPLLDSENNVLGISGIATDITERVHNQQKLILAMKEAEEAKLMQEQFLANMSHEIRTPMNGIQGMTDLLLDTSLTDAQKEFAVIIKRSVSNLLVIINDILDFSKIKAGKLTIEKIDFSLKDVVNNARAIFDHRLKKKGLELQVETDYGVPDQLKGDPHRLNQVLINLVGNAKKFTETGYISLHISSKKLDEGKALLRFAVSDTGIGIPAESLPYIFENFSQGGLDISRKYGGTGLGLAICKQLLQLQGGNISVSSEPGKGSVFSFEIPYEYMDKQGEALPARVNAYDYGQLLGGKRFLVAEDNEINQKLIEHVLEKIGGSVELVGNGEEAVNRLRDHSYDLIIMDLQMPVMDGYTATRYIRTVLQIGTPIVAMTANALKGEQLRCLEAGMNDYMSKPFEFNELYKRLAALLNGPMSLNTQPPGMYLDGSKTYDLGLLEEVGDPEYFLDMLNVFLTNIPEQLKEMEMASGRQDFERVYFMAHKLKGSTGMIQAAALMEILGKIEQLAKEKADVSELVCKASVLYSEIEMHLKEEKRVAELHMRPAL